MDLSPIADILNARASQARPFEDTDYLGEDGLMRCGVCHKKIEHIVDVERIIEEKKAMGRAFDEKLLSEMFKGKKLRCVCDCGDAKRRKREKAERRAQLQFVLPEKREYCFGKSVKYYDNTLDNDNKQGNGYSVVNRYLLQFRSMRKNKKNGLYLYGTTGAGKSYAAASICNGLLNQGLQPKFTSISGIMGSVSNCIRLPTILDGLSECDLIVIDDLTIVNEQIAFEIVDGLTTRCVPLIFTSNKRPEEIKLSSERIHSRVFSACYDIEIKAEKGDRRL